MANHVPCTLHVLAQHEPTASPAAASPALRCSLLRLLGSRWGSVLVIGFKGTRWGVPTAFVDLPRRQREAVLQDWARSPQAKMRKARPPPWQPTPGPCCCARCAALRSLGGSVPCGGKAGGSRAEGCWWRYLPVCMNGGVGR
jgi:hypothetical protein